MSSVTADTETTPAMTNTTATRPEILDRKDTLILRKSLPRDAAANSRIMSEAFADGIQALFYPNGQTDEDRAWSRAGFLNEITKDAHYTTRLTVVDTAAPTVEADLVYLDEAERLAAQSEGRVVGISVWRIFPKVRTQAELDELAASKSKTRFPPSANQEVLKAFAQAVDQSKAKHLGLNPYVLLHIIATDPAYHRRGVGGLHLKWGLREQDRLGVVGYLEASDAGRPLYARLGFQDVEILPFDSLKYGSRDVVHTVMMRQPGTSHTV